MRRQKNGLSKLKKLMKFFLILNPDTYLDRFCLEELIRFYENHSDAGLVEARQFPSEHPKEYSLEDGSTPWCSGACLLIDARHFVSIDGFDETFFMYMEDVDLSWRTHLAGRKCYYVETATCGHATGIFWDHPYTTRSEQTMSLRNHLILLKKFFGHDKRAYDEYLEQFRSRTDGNPLGKAAWDAFEKIEDEIPLLKKDHELIKVLDVGIYHQSRWSLNP